MKFLSNFILFVSLQLLISGCAVTNNVIKMKIVEVEASKNNFKHELVKGGKFWLTTYQRILNDNDRIVFYIEGDGQPFIRRFIISEDPTPRTPMLIRLAFDDPRPNVVYIARPCQYTPMEINTTCNKGYWTDKRMSLEVVQSINEVITKISKDKKFDIIGFSGGGGIAVLVASINNKTNTILTISGNLDHQEFNKYHKVRPMLRSLNPIDYAKNINNIPQLHISGGKDKIVPVFINERYIEASQPTNCVKRHIIPDADHNNYWSKYWDYIINIPIICS